MAIKKPVKNRVFAGFNSQKNDHVSFVFQRRRSVMGVWQNHWRLALQLLAVSGLGPVSLVRGQCFGGVETYEKTSGTTVACDVPGTSCTSKGLLTQPDTSVTRDCIAICKQSANCNSFTVGKNYAHYSPIYRIYKGQRLGSCPSKGSC